MSHFFHVINTIYIDQHFASAGSVVVDASLIFNDAAAVPSPESAVTALNDSLNSGAINLTVDTSSIVSRNYNMNTN